MTQRYMGVRFNIKLLQSLNTPADMFSQLCQPISLILRLYACSISTNLIPSVQKP